MNTNTKAHGLDGTLVEPDWPPLTIKEVRNLLPQFPQCGEAVDIVSTSPRPFSAASVVATHDGPKFVKRHHRGVRDIAALLEEHRFMEHLRVNGARVPQVLQSEAGGTAIQLGEWTYEVHGIVEGIDLYEDAVSWTPFRSVAHAHSAGQSLARLHRSASRYLGAARQTRPLVASFSIFAAKDPRVSMERYIAARPALAGDRTTHRCCAEALQLLKPFHDELLPHLPALEPQWTHNDLHASNLFWSDATNNAQATAVIDFGLCDRTNAVHDIAHAIERNIVEWLKLDYGSGHEQDVPVHLDHLFALLDGYDEIRPLSPSEASALAPMTALCHAEFALTEADYFLGVLHSTEKAGVATRDYLVGHARWYQGEEGRRLLQAMRTWANGQQRRGHKAGRP
jgi:Ser/Thr protein kinase RdoA (MazF antagonist)